MSCCLAKLFSNLSWIWLNLLPQDVYFEFVKRAKPYLGRDIWWKLLMKIISYSKYIRPTGCIKLQFGLELLLITGLICLQWGLKGWYLSFPYGTFSWPGIIVYLWFSGVGEKRRWIKNKVVHRTITERKIQDKKVMKNNWLSATFWFTLYRIC